MNTVTLWNKEAPKSYAVVVYCAQDEYNVVAICSGVNALMTATSLCSHLNGGQSMFWTQAENHNLIEWR